jgi:hypothetical protein
VGPAAAAGIIGSAVAAGPAGAPAIIWAAHEFCSAAVDSIELTVAAAAAALAGAAAVTMVGLAPPMTVVPPTAVMVACRLRRRTCHKGPGPGAAGRRAPLLCQLISPGLWRM